MRITLVTCAFPPAVCGVGDYSERLALAFGERGHEVAVVASTIDAGGGSSERRGMTITRAARRWRGIGAALRVARAVRATRPERVIVQFSPYSHGRFGVAPFMPLLLALLRCLVRARVTVTFHELYLAWPGDAIGGRWRWLAQLSIAVAQRLQALLLIRCATDVVATTRARQRALGRIAKTRAVAMAPVGFAPPLVPLARTQRDELRRAWGAAASSFVVLTFGTVQACKRYEELIDAVAEVVRGGSDVRLVWIGDLTAAPANRMRALRQRIAGLGLQERVRLVGFVAAASVAACIGSADIYAHPDAGGASTKSSALAGALACGVPVLAVQGPDTDTELFMHAETAFLVARADRSSLAAGLRALIASPRLRARLASDGRAAFARQLTWATIAALQDASGEHAARAPGVAAASSLP